MTSMNTTHALPAQMPHRRDMQWCLRAVFDVLAFALCSSFLPHLRDTDYLVVVLVWVFWFGVLNNAYRRKLPAKDEALLLFKSIAVFAFLQMAFNKLAGDAESLPQWQETWLALLMVLPTCRWCARQLLKVSGLWDSPTIIIGKGSNARYARAALQSQTALGLDVRAFVWPDEAATAPQWLDQLPCLQLGHWPQDAEQLRPFHCVVALEADEAHLQEAVLRHLAQAQIADVHVVPVMRGVPLTRAHTTYFPGHEALFVHVSNNLVLPWNRLVKRAFDVLASLVLLLLLSPVFALLAFQVSRDGGSAFFGHSRIGRNGKVFKCFKFRSMVVNAEQALDQLLKTCPQSRAEWVRDFKLKDDPRVSALGRFLRRTSLDELPQLWNVFKGDMSLVGPRPIVRDELARYRDNVGYYLQCTPGITGLWQVSGRNDVDYERRVYLDAWYAKNWTLWNDIVILLKTVLVVFNRAGAY